MEVLSVFTCKTSFYEHITACDIDCAFLTEETATQIKNNVVQLVLISNITKNTLDHTSAAPEQVYGSHQGFMNKQGCPDNFGGGKIFSCPPPNVKVFAFYFYHGLTPPLVWAPGQMSLLPPHPL